MGRLSITYMLWFFGGIFGLHHLYLGRLSHAITYAATLSFCGLGWVYDFFNIPQYVKQANNDPIYLSLLRKQLKHRPPFSFPRAFAMYVASYIMTHLSMSLFGWFEPIQSRIGSTSIAELPLWWTAATTVVSSVGIFFGCLLINNIGRQHTVARNWLYLSIILGCIADLILAHLSSARIIVICRALFPTCFYIRSCEWLPHLNDPRLHNLLHDRGSNSFLGAVLGTTRLFSNEALQRHLQQILVEPMTSTESDNNNTTPTSNNAAVTDNNRGSRVELIKRGNFPFTPSNVTTRQRQQEQPEDDHDNEQDNVLSNNTTRSTTTKRRFSKHFGRAAFTPHSPTLGKDDNNNDDEEEDNLLHTNSQTTTKSTKNNNIVSSSSNNTNNNNNNNNNNKVMRYIAPTKRIIPRGALFFLSQLIYYIIYCSIFLTLMGFSLYHFTDVFVDINGALEYSDSNYGVNGSLSLQQIQSTLPNPEDFMNNSTLYTLLQQSSLLQQQQQEQGDAKNGPLQTQNTHTYSKLKPFGWSLSSLPPHSATNSSSSTTTTATTQNDSTINPTTSTDTVLSPEGYQPLYNYDLFVAQLYHYYQYHIQHNSAQQQHQQQTNSTIYQKLNELSLPYHYRFKDLIRNAYYSPLYHQSFASPLTRGLKEEDGDIFQLPYFSPVQNRKSLNNNNNDDEQQQQQQQQQTNSHVPMLIENLVINKINSALYMVQKSYQYVKKHGVVSFIQNMDVSGRSWALYYLNTLKKDLQEGRLSENGLLADLSKQYLALHKVQLQGALSNNPNAHEQTHLEPLSADDVNFIVHHVLMNVLALCDGDVRVLSHNQQHLLYDTLVAYARL